MVQGASAQQSHATERVATPPTCVLHDTLNSGSMALHLLHGSRTVRVSLSSLHSGEASSLLESLSTSEGARNSPRPLVCGPVSHVVARFALLSTARGRRMRSANRPSGAAVFERVGWMEAAKRVDSWRCAGFGRAKRGRDFPFRTSRNYTRNAHALT